MYDDARAGTDYGEFTQIEKNDGPLEYIFPTAAINEFVSFLADPLKKFFGFGVVTDNNTPQATTLLRKPGAGEDGVGAAPVIDISYTVAKMKLDHEENLAATPRPTIAVDASTSLNDGTISATGVTSVAGQTGFGNAFRFDGASGKVGIPDNLIKNNVVITISAWFKTTTDGVIIGYQNTILPTGPSAWVPAIYVGTDGKLRGELYQGSISPIISIDDPNTAIDESIVTDGNWHHVALVANVDTQTLYLDGVAQGTLSGTINYMDMSFNQIGSGKTDFYPGGRAILEHFFNGELDDVRIYTTALTQDQIVDLRNKGLEGNP